MRNKHRYPANWHDTIRPAVLLRDGHKCTECGAKQRSIGYFNEFDQFVQCDEFMIEWAARNNKKIYVIHLQVAHLDQDPSNNNMSNLATFCPRHHFKYDNVFNIVKRKAKR